MARMQRSLFDQLNALAAEIAQSPVKTAAEKSAGPVPADPGGYQGASSHPTTSADNGVQNASTGARASEYEADVKKQQGALAVDNTPEMSQEGRQDEVQTNIGVSAKATGEDPANEKDFKGDKDDPGTSSPVKANDGEKYSSVTFKEARDRAGALGNDILANLINFGASKLNNEKAAEMPAFIQAKIDAKKEPAGDSAKHEAAESPAVEKAEEKAEEKVEAKAAAFKAGYELAAHLGLDKEAAEASVRDVCANTIREADEMADLFIGFVNSKAAAADPTEEATEGEDHSAPEDAASGASDAPAGDAPAGGAPAGLEAMMGAEGGPSPEAAGGEPSEDEAVQELAMALEELGIPPEALLHALSGAGGAEGGAPPEAGAAPEAGMPPMEEPKMAAAKDLDAIGRAVVNFKRAGKFQVKEARTKRSRQLRDMMKQHVLELVNR